MTAVPIPSSVEMYQKVYVVPIDENDNSINWSNLVDNHIQKITYDSSGRQEYIGFAKPGTADDVAGWQIRKMTYTGSGYNYESILFADGNTFFDNKWSLKASYAYS